MSIASGFTKMKNYILTSSGYKLLSRWTSSQTVHMGDGTDDTDTVEYRFGAMKGVTSSLATDNDEYALSASAGKNLQDQCTQLNQSLGSEEISSVGTNVKNAINNLYYTSATILGGLNRILHGYDAATGRFLIQFVFSNNDIHAITFGMSDIQYSHWDGSKWTIIWTK